MLGGPPADMELLERPGSVLEVHELLKEAQLQVQEVAGSVL